MLGVAAQDNTLAGVRPNALDDAPQLRVDIDHDEARALGLDLADVNDTISAAWGGSYINDFIDTRKLGLNPLPTQTAIARRSHCYRNSARPAASTWSSSTIPALDIRSCSPHAT